MADEKEAAAKEASLVRQRHDQAMLELQVGSSAQNGQRSNCPHCMVHSMLIETGQLGQICLTCRMPSRVISMSAMSGRATDIHCDIAKPL